MTHDPEQFGGTGGLFVLVLVVLLLLFSFAVHPPDKTDRSKTPQREGVGEMVTRIGRRRMTVEEAMSLECRANGVAGSQKYIEEMVLNTHHVLVGGIRLYTLTLETFRRIPVVFLAWPWVRIGWV